MVLVLHLAQASLYMILCYQVALEALQNPLLPFLLENQDCQLALDIQVSQDSQDHLQALDLHLHLEALESLEAQGVQGCYHPLVLEDQEGLLGLADLGNLCLEGLGHLVGPCHLSVLVSLAFQEMTTGHVLLSGLVYLVVLDDLEPLDDLGFQVNLANPSIQVGQEVLYCI